MIKDLQIDTVAKKDMWLCIPIFWYMFMEVFCVFGNYCLESMGYKIPEVVLLFFRFGVTLVLMIKSFLYLSKNKKIILLISEVFLTCSYLYTYIQGYTHNEQFLVYLVMSLVLCVPFGVFVSDVTDYHYLEKCFQKIAMINTPILLIYLISTIGVINYDMPASYKLLFCILVHISYCYNRNIKDNILWIVLIAFEIIVLILRGARGPVFCLLFFFIIKEVINKKSIFRLIILGLLGITSFLYINIIINITSGVLFNFDISSRIINQVETGTLLEDSGRGNLLGTAINLINENPILGYGASSETHFLYGGQYVHNLLLELCFDYGYLIGGVLFCCILYKVINILLAKPSIVKDIGEILLVHGFFMLFISGTYLQSIYFFMMIGLNISSYKKVRVVI